MPKLTYSAKDARRLANFISSLHGFQVESRNHACYAHMGATISDTILQAGLNYRHVVAPRVQNLIRRWPSANLTSSFHAKIEQFGLATVLNWQDPEKPRRIIALTELLLSENVDTEQDLRAWLLKVRSKEMLMAIRGIGPKTADYIKTLVGLPAVAVDRHVRTFLSWAGVNQTGYDQISETVAAAADLLGLEHQALDHAIWRFVSQWQQQNQFIGCQAA